MGNFCIGSKIYLDPTFKPYKSQFEALKFKPTEVVRLKRIFDSIDIDHSGSIGLKELLTHLDIESNNKFSKRVFSIFDEDGSGQVDFREFVLSIWNYCTLSQATLALFAFDLYDADRTGFLSPVEIEGILKDLYGSEAVSTNLQAKIISGELNKFEQKNSLDVDKFARFCYTHPALLFPAFQMQYTLQQHCMGVGFWERASRRRVQLSKGGKYVPLAVLATMNVNQEMYNKYLSQTPKSPSTLGGAGIVLQNTGTLHYRSQQAKTDGVTPSTTKFGIKATSPEDRAVGEQLSQLEKIHNQIQQTAAVTVLPTRSSIKVSGRIKPCTSDDMTLGSGSGSRPTSPMPSTKASSSTDESSKAKGKAGESRKREKRRTFDGASSLGAVGECRKAAELPTSGISDRPHSAVPTGVVDQRSRRRTTGSVKYSPNPSTK